MQRLVLVVDGYTANFPWEMMIADEKPIVTQMRLVRQFASSQFRTQVRSSPSDAVYIVGNPCTKGFRDFFPKFTKATVIKGELDSLKSAEQEAEAVRDLLKKRYDVVTAIGNDKMAHSVIGRLFEKPFHIVHITAHGVFNVVARDGKQRTGVVLSDGLMLTAAEISMMETVPELFFLNCCHLGKTDSFPRDTHRIAYSLARELIEMGVRCVVAAGWEVDEDAGNLFATTFYEAMLSGNKCFADALFDARRKVYEQFPKLNTWGAYQAYGDPQFLLDPTAADGPKTALTDWISPLQLQATLEEEMIEAGVGIIGRDAVIYQGSDFPAKEVISNRITAMINSAPTEMIKLPEIQYAIGSIYGELGDFQRATSAYETAIRAADQNGLLSVKAIEQLANLEAREGERTNDETLVRTALARLYSLLCIALPLDCSQERFEASINFQNARHGNSERLALYGSACKRMAILVARKDEGFDESELRCWLKRASDAYGAGGGLIGTPTFNPYNVLNQIQLAAILGVNDEAERSQLAAIAQSAAEVAEKKARKGHDFFDAVMPVDAEVAIALLSGRLTENEEAITKHYQIVLSALPSSMRVADSVRKQLKLLAELCERLNNPKEAKALRCIEKNVLS